MNWKEAAQQVESLQSDQLRQIEQAQQAEAVWSAEVAFQYQSEADIRGYLVDLEDSLRFNSLGFFKDPLRNYVVGQRILRQFYDGRISIDHFTSARDKDYLLSVLGQVENAVVDAAKRLTKAQRLEAEECSDAVDLVPVLRYAALNASRREELEVITAALAELEQQIAETRRENLVILAGVCAVMLILYLLAVRFLFQVSLVSPAGLLTLLGAAAVGILAYIALRGNLPPGLQELRDKRLSLQQDIWLSLTPEQIALARQYLSDSSQEIRDRIEEKAALAVRILGEDWEKKYRKNYLAMD